MKLSAHLKTHVAENNKTRIINLSVNNYLTRCLLLKQDEKNNTTVQMLFETHVNLQTM